MILKMFHRPKPRQFNHIPIYYNPDSEAQKKAKEADQDLRTKMRAERESKTSINFGRKSINITIYGLIILFLIYLIFFS